jgi:hypothetical protein
MIGKFNKLKLRGDKVEDQRRNLNPTKAAKVAMIIWGKEYSEQGGGSMDFWDRLTPEEKRRCEIVVRELSGKRIEPSIK